MRVKRALGTLVVRPARAAKSRRAFGLNKILNMLKNFLEVGRVTYTPSTRRGHVSSTSYTLRTRFDFNRMRVWASVERACKVCQACLEHA